MNSTPSIYRNPKKVIPSSGSFNLPNLGRNTTHNNKSFSKYSKGNMRTLDAPARSSYITAIKDLTDNTEYTDMNVETIGQEQRKLKDILKKMNSDTIRMIDHISPKNIAKKNKRDSHSTLEVKQMEGLNNDKILENCQWEVQRLTHRLENVLKEDKGYYLKRIEEASNELEKVSAEVRQLKW